jgi:hypothetical protein
VNLPGMEPPPTVGDELDRFYTPFPLALAIAVRRFAALRASAVPYVVEPSCGGGAFVRACHHVEPVALVEALDADPMAKGLALASYGTVVDFLDWRPTHAIDLMLGNFPFGDLEAHLDHALGMRPRMASFILPLDRLGRGSMFHRWFDRPHGMRLASVEAIHPRPWPDHVRETACYTWERCTSGVKGPDAVLGAPLVWR